jgi:hypothetical protein
MAQVKTIERQIYRIESFNVVIYSPEGRKVRRDRRGFPAYDYARAAKGAMTVARWKRERFSRTYPGFTVDVLDGAGAEAQGNARLLTVRQSYVEG